MPNGFHGPKEEWQRLEAPLKSIDGALEAYAQSHDLALSRNYHAWPERSLRWGTKRERLIQIFLHDEKRVTFNIWLGAYEDRGSKRYWKQRTLREDVPIGEIAENLHPLLEAGRVEVEGWTSDELELAGPVAAGPGGRSLLVNPSAFLPIVMSLSALALVLGHVARYGVTRGADEGTAAHVFQLLMAAQAPIVAFFAVKWLPRRPRPALRVLALQVAAALAAVAAVLWLT